MRSSRRAKIQKKPYKHPRINKKKYKKRSKESWGWNDDNISGHFLNNINEVLRENKAQRAEGKGSWKVVPKDSCEVYKNRLKRERENRRKQKISEHSSNGSESQMDIDNKKDMRKSRKKSQKKKVPARKYKVQKTRFRKRSRRSSPSSYTNTTTSLSTTYSTISEMDYD